MNCPKCNAPVGARDTFCLNCGQKLEVAQASPYTNPASYGAAPAAPAAAAAAMPAKKASPIAGLLKGDKIKKLIPVAAIVVVAVIVISIISAIAGSPKTIAKKYIQAELEGDIYTMVKNEMYDDAACKKIVKSGAKRAGLSEKTLYANACADINEDLEEGMPAADFKNYKGFMKYVTEVEQIEEEEYLINKYGDDYKIDIEIVDVEKVDKATAAEYRMELAMELAELREEGIKVGFDADNAKQFKRVYYHYTISGSEDTYDTRDDSNKPRELLLVKIKGDWKVFYGDEGFDYLDYLDLPF